MSEGWISVADAQRAAAERLDPPLLGYFDGGAGDEVTLRENVDAWSRWRLRPRVLVDTTEISTGIELLGGPPTSPILVAPVAFQRLLDPEGELATARAAAAAGSIFCLSSLANVRPAEVAVAAPSGRRWFQLYRFRDEGVTRALLEEAEGAGFEAIVLTVDAPPGGNRERDLRSGFRVPAEVGIPSIAAALGSERAVSVFEAFELMSLVKGVLTPEDATLAVGHGAAGVVVSNHGGRQLDRSPACGDVLAEIVDAVEARLAVLVDGGIRRGVDVATALALGADAVLVGRPVVWGLAGAGEAGVRRVLELLRNELELALALCGATSPEALGRSHLRRAPAAAP
jgi:isopentenyl diphosphate isomerase/L-lactate dehydrogenase-like FMN-dependent dehydrogenase